jgi:hypothetical protein
MSVSELRARFQQPSTIKLNNKRRITPSLSNTKSIALLFSEPTVTSTPIENQNIQHKLQLTVKQLCYIFEHLASQYGLLSNDAKTSWLAALESRIAKSTTTIGDLKLDKELVQEIALDAGLIQEKDSERIEQTEQDIIQVIDSVSKTSDQVFDLKAINPAKAEEECMISKILPSSTIAKETHDCDMIVCSVVTKTIDGHRVHEIDLKCQGCSSQFVLTAAHECETECTPTLPGLEWLSDGAGVECINMVL